MNIRFDTEGRIIACSAVPGILTGVEVLTIDDAEVPHDLLVTFALGKYLVKDGRLIESAESPAAKAALEGNAETASAQQSPTGQHQGRAARSGAGGKPKAGAIAQPHADAHSDAGSKSAGKKAAVETTKASKKGSGKPRKG